jgi:hypothetical protein
MIMPQMHIDTTEASLKRFDTLITDSYLKDMTVYELLQMSTFLGINFRLMLLRAEMAKRNWAAHVDPNKDMNVF